MAKYAYGYEVLDLLDKKRKARPSSVGDRFHTKDFGQALRYGQYAVVAVCGNKGLAVDAPFTKSVQAILSQWVAYEEWAEKLSTNAAYRTGSSRTGSSFDYISYYKGSTVNADLEKYPFTI